MVGVEDCTYLISWPSALTCPHEEPEKLPKLENCILEDQELGYYFDFNQNNENTFSAANFEYKFDICDGVQDITECQGSAVCGKNKENGNWESFGKIDQMTVLKPFEMAAGIALELKFDGGKKCKNSDDDFTTIIWFRHDFSNKKILKVIEFFHEIKNIINPLYS